MPAINTPQNISDKAFFQGIPKRKAAIDPVQAPVTGNGMATKIIKASCPYFWYLPANFFLARSKSQEKNLLAVFDRLIKNSDTGPSSQSMKNAGKIFPITEIKKSGKKRQPVNSKSDRQGRPQLSDGQHGNHKSCKLWRNT